MLTPRQKPTNLSIFKKSLNNREKLIVNYLISCTPAPAPQKPGSGSLESDYSPYISIKQIHKDNELDYQSVIDIINSLERVGIVERRIKKYYPVVECGGRRYSVDVRLNYFALYCLCNPYFGVNTENKKSFLSVLKKRNSREYNKIVKNIFNFKIF